MNRRKTTAVLATLALAWAPLALQAQTSAERAELAADAAGQTGPVPQGTQGGIQCPAGTNPTSFYFSDFEADDGGWTGTGAAPWEWGAVVTGVQENCDNAPNEDEPPGAFSGANAWATNLDGCYTNSGSASQMSQTFDFSGLAAPIELSWWNWYEVFFSFDTAEVLANGGAVFAVSTSAPTPAYLQETADLSAFAGNASVTIDFELFATTVVNRAGWYVDDVAITFCGQDADLGLTKSADNPNPAPGSNVVYTLTVTNNGPGDATGVVVTDDLPMGVAYVADDCGGSFASPTFTWNVGALANGASAACNVTVNVTAASGDLVNNAVVTSAGNDPVPANNTASSSITVGQPLLEIPTLGTLGFVLLALLLAVSAALLIRRRGRQA